LLGRGDDGAAVLFGLRGEGVGGVALGVLSEQSVLAERRDGAGGELAQASVDGGFEDGLVGIDLVASGLGGLVLSVFEGLNFDVGRVGLERCDEGLGVVEGCG